MQSHPTRPTRAVYRLVGACLVVALGATVLAQIPQSQPPQQPGASSQAAIYPASYSTRWIDDLDFVYGPRLLNFDFRGYLAERAPHLLPHAEYLSHWCGYYSISPKLLLAVIELRSGAVSSGASAEVMENPLRGLVPGTGFQEQVQNALALLFRDFYAYRGAVKTPAPDGLNAATYALSNLFRGDTAPADFAAAAEPVRTGLAQTYQRLFPEGFDISASATDPAIDAVPPDTLLQLPWKAGVSWYFGGVHTTSGANNGTPMSSLDFYRGGAWGTDTSTDYVVASHGGTVTVYSSCNVTVTDASGWATNYYHLQSVAVANGASVTPNQTLAVYANSQAQALCQGGSSTGPHVHWSLLKDGIYNSLDGVAVSAFVVHPGEYSYDVRSSTMWLTKNATNYYVGPAIQSALTAAPAVPTMTINDVSVTEGNSGTTNATFTVSLSEATVNTVTVNYQTVNNTATTGTMNTVASNASSISIPNSGTATPYPSTLTVSSGLGSLSKVTATVTGFSHTYPGDVDIMLVGPGGQSVVLLSDAGGQTDGVNLTMTFDDLGSAATTAALASGTYRPTNLEVSDTWSTPAPSAPSGTALSVFNGLNPAGTWRLYVVDDALGDVGSISGGWALTLTTPSGDYLATSGSLTFSPGQTSKTIAVVVNGDTTVEANETFYVDLSGVSAAVVGDSRGVGTIVNDDIAPFTDATLTPGTGVKAIHITELRTRINTVRYGRGLSLYSWTDSSLSGVSIKAVHILEMRTALAQVYSYAALIPPTYTDATLSGVFVKTTHITQLRSAVTALE